MIVGHPHDRLELVAEQISAGQRQPDSAHPEERVGFLRHRHVVQWLVAAHVQGAQGDAPPRHGLGDLPIRRLLLVDGGRGGPPEEAELGADQARQVGSGRGAGVVDGSEVRPDQDGRPVQRDGGLVGPGEGRRRALFCSRRPPAELGQHGFGGIDHHVPGRAVHRDHRAGLRLGDQPADPDDGRDPAGPQQDGAVRGRAAVSEYHRGRSRGVEDRGLGRRQVGGDQHTVDLDRGARRPAEPAQHPVAHITHVGRPRLQVLVGKRGHVVCDGVEAVRPRPGRARSGLDPPSRGLDQVRVVEQQQLGVEDRGLGLADLDRGPVTDHLEVVADLAERVLQPVQVLARIGGVLVRKADRRVAQRPRRTDADPGRGGDRPGRSRPGRRSGSGFAESVPGQVEEDLHGLVGLRPARADLHLVALEGAESGDLRQACRGDETAAHRAVAQMYFGIEPTDGLHHERRRSRVQAVRHRHGEDRLLATPLRREIPADRRGGRQLGLFGRQRLGGLACDLDGGGARIGGHRGHDQALDQRRGGEDDAAAAVVVQELHGEFGGQDSAAQVHQHDDPVATIGSVDGVVDGHGVGSQGAVVEPGGDLDGGRAAVQHLGGQCNSGVRERSAVRDHHDADRHVSGPAKASAAAATSSAADVAPGSWWPTLRSPR